VSNLVQIVDANGRPIGEPVRVLSAVGDALIRAGKARKATKPQTRKATKPRARKRKARP